MTWTKKSYPKELDDLRAEIRYKAIAIANRLVADEEGEKRAITVAVIQAKEWAKKKHKKIWKRHARERNE